MDADLQRVIAVLAESEVNELHALIDAAHKAPRIAPGLLSWIEGACDWELNRRTGLGYPLQPPEAAIPPEEDAVSIDAAMAMRSMFAQDSRVVLALFDAIVDLLIGAERRHWCAN
jgi:hypothetical protein